MTKSFKCPHCGEVHRKYVPSGKSRTPRCMKCNKLVPKNLVPEKYIRNSPAKWFRLFKKKGKKQITKEDAERKVKSRSSKKKGKKQVSKEGTKREAERKEKTKEGTERESLFIRPKSSHKILGEVLREFNCNDVFIRAMIRRSSRIGGMHPGDLRHHISSMNSGIRSRDQAAFIADEYRFALDEERDKAQRADYKKAYPSERRRERERYESPSRVRKDDYYARHPEERHPGAYKEPYRRGRDKGERVSKRDVREMVEETLERMEQKREREEILRNLGNRITRIESDMANIPSQINEGMSKVLEKRKDTERTKGITKADINNAVNNAVLNVEKKYMERELKNSTEESKEREKEFQKTIGEVSKERNELLKELSARRSADTSDYQTDSCKVIGEAVRGLKDVIETRHPVKLAIEGIPKLLYPGGEGLTKRKAPELKEDKTKTIGGGVWKYLDNEYVAEK